MGHTYFCDVSTIQDCELQHTLTGTNTDGDDGHLFIFDTLTSQKQGRPINNNYSASLLVKDHAHTFYRNFKSFDYIPVYEMIFLKILTTIGYIKSKTNQVKHC